MYGFEGLDFICKTWLILLPLGIWKLIDIIIWIVKHIKIDIIF